MNTPDLPVIEEAVPHQGLAKWESKASPGVIMPSEVRGELPPPALFSGSTPLAIITHATQAADALKMVIKKQGLISVISGKEYPRCEAWTLLGTIVGVFPVLVWSKLVENGWEARVEARTLAGAIVGAAEAQCLRSERNWQNRDDFALRSMAQTRATAKALRMPLGFVMTLAGYQVTPAEEMDSESRPVTRQARNRSELPLDEPQAKTKAKIPPNASAVPDGEFVAICTIVDVVEKSGRAKANDKPWTAWFIKMNDGFGELEAGTFSSTIADLARAGMGQKCQFQAKIGPGQKRGTHKIIDLTPMEGRPPVQEQAPPAPEEPSEECFV